MAKNTIPEVVVALERVSKSFITKDHSTHVLQSISLVVERGEFLAIVGRSGAGKSTLLRLIGGLLEADEGWIRIGGLNADAARSQKFFGFMPQKAALLSWLSVLDNVELPAKLNKKNSSSKHHA